MMYPITTLSIILICALVIVIAYTWYKISKLKKQLDITAKSNVALTSINKDNKIEIQKLKQLNIDYENSLTNMSVPSSKSQPNVSTKKAMNSAKNYTRSDNKNSSDEDLNNLATLAVVSLIILDDSDSDIVKAPPITSVEDSFDHNAYNEANFKSTVYYSNRDTSDSSDSYDRSSNYGSSSSSSSYDSGSSSSSDSSSSSSSSSD